MPLAYLETIENDVDLPNGTYYGYWQKHTVLIKAWEHVYALQVTRFQRTDAVPVTCVVENRLIDIYLGAGT